MQNQNLLSRLAHVICLLFLSSTLAAQEGTRIPPPRNITIFRDQTDSSVYAAMQEFITANHPVSYVSPLLLRFSPIRSRTQELVLGEGKNGYLLEGLTDLNFTVMQGRSGNGSFFQTSRFTLRYAPAVRMTFDNSNNLIPSNQKIGLSIDKVIANSYIRSLPKDSARFSHIVERVNWAKLKEPFWMLYASLTAMHYSNGQAQGVWFNNDPATNRNDYIKGDFSTNILNLNFTYVNYNRRLLSFNAGYQFDASWGGAFSYKNEQKYRYGQHRLMGYAQWISRPLKNPFGATLIFRDRINDSAYIIDRKWEWKLRYEWEYIMGSLRNFPGSAKYRYNSHLYLEGMPLRSRTVGYLIHLFYGRDYFNIRYDDIVFGAMAGISIKLKRYRNPRFNHNDAVLGITDKPTKSEERYKKQKVKLQQQ